MENVIGNPADWANQGDQVFGLRTGVSTWLYLQIKFVYLYPAMLDSSDIQNNKV